MAERKREMGVKEAAAFLGVSPNTLRKWSDQEIVHAGRLPGSAYRRYTLDELRRVRREVMNLPDEPASN